MQRNATLFATLTAGLVIGAGGSKLLGATVEGRTYFVHASDLRQAPLPDGGVSLSHTAYAIATAKGKDGGSVAVDLGGKSCPLSKVDEACAKELMVNSRACFQ